MSRSPQPVYCFAGEVLLIIAPGVRRLDCPLALKKETMHIHGNSMNIQSANLYSAAQSERAAAAQRANEVRRRLLKSAQSIDAMADCDPGATLLLGYWLGSRHSEVLPQDEYHTAASGKDPDFG
jgi:hypothetical protein